MRMRILAVACHLLVLSGFFLIMCAWFAILASGVHGLGHEEWELSRWAQLFGDFSRLPGLVPVYTVTTAALLAGTGWLVHGDRRIASIFRTHLAVMAAVFLGMATVAIPLVGTDFLHLPWYFDVPPFAFIPLLGAGMFLLAFGGSLLLLHLWTNHGVYLYAFALLPVVPVVFLMWAYPAGTLEAEGRVCMPGAYPRPEWVSAVVAVLVAGGLGLSWLWRRVTGEPSAGQVGVITAGFWAWVVLGIVGIVMGTPYHHSCLRGGYERFQVSVEGWVTGGFVCLWAAILVVQWLRYGRRRREKAGRPVDGRWAAGQRTCGKGKC